MVRKLIKYDFHSYIRLLLPVQLILIGIAAINRIVQFFEPAANQVAMTSANGRYTGISGSGVYHTVFISSIVLYVISIIVCLVITAIVAVRRFYQGMYTNEGYLSHTLPVTPTQHIFAKLLTSLIFTVGSLFAIFLSFIVITFGDMNIEIFKAFFYIMGDYFKVYGGQTALYILEAVVLVIVFCSFYYLKLYCCISVGQLVQKKKILLAFGVFFGIYVIKQIIGTILIITVFNNYDLMAQISDWIAKNATTYLHILLCSAIVFSGIFGLIYFLISKHIMSKKLNLN